MGVLVNSLKSSHCLSRAKRCCAAQWRQGYQIWHLKTSQNLLLKLVITLNYKVGVGHKIQSKQNKCALVMVRCKDHQWSRAATGKTVNEFVLFLYLLINLLFYYILWSFNEEEFKQKLKFYEKTIDLIVPEHEY